MTHRDPVFHRTRACRLALDARIRRQSDAAQQETAEWLGSWTVVLVGGHQALVGRGDTEGAERWRDQAPERLESADMLDEDLTDVRLTRGGVVGRRGPDGPPVCAAFAPS